MGHVTVLAVVLTTALTVGQGFQFGEAALPRVKRQAAGRSNVQVGVGEVRDKDSRWMEPFRPLIR